MDDNIRQLHTNGGVEIVKASAGSGKTFTLSREYIRLLLQKKNEGARDAHRHILAVTFTNKATGEMKSRIIRELDILAHSPLDSDHREYLMRECGIKTIEELSARADNSLTSILNDYGGFSVCTIDRFFQQALRAFAKEAGHVDEYQVELDKPSLVSESVDRLLDSLSDKDTRLLQWLSESSLSSLELGDGYHLESRLNDFAAEYTKEAYANAEKDNGIDRKEAFSEENLRELTRICTYVRKSYEERLRALGTSLADFLDTLEGVSGYTTRFVTRLKNYRLGDKVDYSSATWNHLVHDVPKAFNKGKWTYGATESDTISNIALAIESLNRERATADLLRTQVSLFRVADALDKEFEALLKEKNVLSLDDTNKILHDIIGGTDAPFIYEKLGVRYNDFLLDEFQDTARVQWENFRPLLSNSIAEACYNLIVGDVKQSIYRWREADWSILDSSVEKDLDRHHTHPLSGNHRSRENIVRFNNSFFKTFAYRLDRKLETTGSDISERGVSDIYADVEQTVCKDSEDKGGVSICFCDNNMVNLEVLGAVIRAHDLRGYAYKDMSVIVRTNSEGAGIASTLIMAGIPVVSNDSLRISAGKTVKVLVSQLYKLDNSRDRINTWYAPESFDPSRLSGCKSLTETVCKMLEDLDAEEVDRETLYVLAFLDLVKDYSSRNGNSLHSFLEYWSEEGIKKSISTPQGSDAVTIITIHKVKGLSTPVAIIPTISKLVSGKEKSWECPDLGGTVFGTAKKALYNVTLTDSLGKTYFSDEYAKKLQTIFVDVINVWYVAFTRAKEEMHIISPFPSQKTMELPSGDWSIFSSVQGALYLFCRDCGECRRVDSEDGILRMQYGGFTPKRLEEKGEDNPGQIRLSYNADTPVSLRGKLCIKSDADEFFSGECSTGPRRRGIVLHGIMQNIKTASDIADAVRDAVMSGLLASSEQAGTEEMIREAVASVSGRGWFSHESGRLLDEREIADSGGRIHRPDRVIVKGDEATIIDYKFGEEDSRYLTQVRNYASLYRRLGFKDVKSFIWYVEKGKIVEG